MHKVFKEIKSSKGNKVYSVILLFTDNGLFLPEYSLCSCMYEVFRTDRKKTCRHIKEALKEYDEEQRIKFIKRIKLNGEKNNG